MMGWGRAEAGSLATFAQTQLNLSGVPSDIVREVDEVRSSSTPVSRGLWGGLGESGGTQSVLEATFPEDNDRRKARQHAGVLTGLIEEDEDPEILIASGRGIRGFAGY